MKRTTRRQSSYATLFDPVVARAVAARAAQLNLPRRECHPLDRYPGRRVAADLAAYDAEVELTATPEEVIPVEPQYDETRLASAADTDLEDEVDF